MTNEQYKTLYLKFVLNYTVTISIYKYIPNESKSCILGYFMLHILKYRSQNILCLLKFATVNI